jgi:type II secretory pathway pseudopilin PulG
MRKEPGYAMAALLVGMAVMAIMLGVALPVWRTVVQREREAELVFRGEQYANAIAIFQRRTGGYPQTLDVLEKTRAIRKLYKDPITGGDFQPIFVGQVVGGAPVVPGQRGRGPAGQTPAGGPVTPPTGARGRLGGARGTAPTPFAAGGLGQGGAAGPIIGVVSRSTATSLRLYNGRGTYNEWAFVATEATQQAGAPTGGQNPGSRGAGPRGGAGQQNPFGPRGAQPANPAGRINQPRGGPSFPGRGIQQPGGGSPGVPPGTIGLPAPTSPQR